jgi:hypothetical protein
MEGREREFVYAGALIKKMKKGLHSDRLYIHDELGVEGDLGGGVGGGGIYSICPYMERIIQTVGVVKSLYIVAGAAAAGSQ